MADNGDDIPRGPKGGRKHKPGHDRKSLPGKKARFKKKAEKERDRNAEIQRRFDERWASLSKEKQDLLGPEGPAEIRKAIEDELDSESS